MVLVINSTSVTHTPRQTQPQSIIYSDVSVEARNTTENSNFPSSAPKNGAGYPSSSIKLSGLLKPRERRG